MILRNSHGERNCHVRFVPIADSCIAAINAKFPRSAFSIENLLNQDYEKYMCCSSESDQALA
jgi:hypothetical protein